MPIKMFVALGRIMQKSIPIFMAIILTVSFHHAAEGGTSETLGSAQMACNKVIDDMLPAGWSVVERTEQVVPAGHYWGMRYNGPKGCRVLIRGGRDVFIHWLDGNDVWRKEAIAREAIELSFMPPNYHESWRRFFVVHRPMTAKILYSTKSEKVYYYVKHSIVNRERFDELLKLAKATRWPDSPQDSQIVSWTTWKSDLRRIFKNE